MPARVPKTINVWPRNTPVHLAQTGNCTPLKWRLLSGIWWQPNQSPKLPSANLIWSNRLSKCFATVHTHPYGFRFSFSHSTEAAEKAERAK